MVKADVGEYEESTGQDGLEHSILLFLVIGVVERQFRQTVKTRMNDVTTRVMMTNT